MSTPRPAGELSIRALPLAIFALVLLIPFLNFEFTLYRSTLKLFVFETATALLWCYLLWEWGAGAPGPRPMPAWWLFVPVGLWVAWGLATSAWSPWGWLAGGGVAQSVFGAAGALGLALLLRDAAHRRTLVAAGSAIAFALAFFMLLYYGDPRSRFLGDIDHLGGREAGAAFLLLPTLVAAAVLYQRAKAEGEAGWRGVVWTVVVLVVLLLAGVRTGVAAWRYALGAGLAVAAWLMLPRWRLAAGALALIVVSAAAQREVQQTLAAADYTDVSLRAAVLDKADWGLVRRASVGRLLFGNGVGTFFLALDRERPPTTYAVSRGDEVIGHARRQLTEALFERGVVGVALALAAGLACVAAGGLAFRRARDGLDSALGAGLAASVVAMGVFACFSNGLIGFGSGVMLWVALGLLGALSIESGRPAGLSWSREEEAWHADSAPRAHTRKLALALAGVGVVVAAWLVLAVRPFWAEYCLREGQAEDEARERLLDQKRLGEQTLRQLQAAAKQEQNDLDVTLRTAEEELRVATTAYDDAVKAGAEEARRKELAAARQEAAAAVEKLRAAAPRKKAAFDAMVSEAEAALHTATAEYQASAARTAGLLRRAARLSLGDRVWLSAQLGWGLLDAGRGDPAAALARYERLAALCGPALDLDVLCAGCLAKLARPAEAHQLYARYARRNPFGVLCALYNPRVRFLEDWSSLIVAELAKKTPAARAWADDFLAAATEGLALHPNHYGLLLFRGNVHYRLGQKDRSRADMMAASAIIERALREAEVPLVRATLWFELANANTLWDRGKALKAAKQVFVERIDLHDPQCQPVLWKARQIIQRLEPARKPAPKAPAPKGQAPKAAPPAKTEREAEPPAGPTPK